jgi:hypothetical protein
LYQYAVIHTALLDVLPSHDARSLCRVSITVTLRYTGKYH